MSDSVENTAESREMGKKSKAKIELFEWLEIIVAAIAVVIILFTLVFKVITISGDSMLNTLHNGEKILISNLFYEPKRGDIVVISRNTNNSTELTSQETCIIKRIIATEGQVVDINFKTGVVSVDGIDLSEDYTYTKTNVKGDIEFPVVVPEGHVFVLGDNRNNSSDSRFSTLGYNGMVDERNILGRAVIRILPFDRFGVLLNE